MFAARFLLCGGGRFFRRRFCLFGRFSGSTVLRFAVVLLAGALLALRRRRVIKAADAAQRAGRLTIGHGERHRVALLLRESRLLCYRLLRLLYFLLDVLLHFLRLPDLRDRFLHTRLCA